ncbi:DNA/RNA non-specific endonuclease [Gemmatimonadota bacterium]
MNRIYIAILALILIPSTVNADYLEVRRSVSLKARPESGAVVLLKLDVGDYLALVQNEKENGYYYAQLYSGGPAGWVYQSFVRRYPGDTPPEAPVPDNPLADPSIHITANQQSFAARHLEIGKPQAVYERVREGYVTAVDARLKIPLWVQYQLSRDDLDGSAEREDNFYPDTSIPRNARARLQDYVGSRLDRGHMAPAADMVRSQAIMDESFALSNMSPQVGVGFNQHIWRDLEVAVRGWVEARGTLTIITGPIFTVEGDSVRYRVIGPTHVAVPTAFYKIIVDHNTSGETEVLAFRMPNQNISGNQIEEDSVSIEEFLVSVDDLEAETGLDFLSALPNEEERRIELSAAIIIW